MNSFRCTSLPSALRNQSLLPTASQEGQITSTNDLGHPQDPHSPSTASTTWSPLKIEAFLIESFQIKQHNSHRGRSTEAAAMHKRLPACSQDTRHHPETAHYKSCRACNRVFEKHLSGRLTTLLRAKVQLSRTLQATGAVCNPTPRVNISTEHPWNKTGTIQETNMRNSTDGRDCSMTTEEPGSSISSACCTVRGDTPIPSSQPHLHPQLSSPHQVTTHRDYNVPPTVQVLPLALLLQRKGNTINSKLCAKD